MTCFKSSVKPKWYAPILLLSSKLQLLKLTIIVWCCFEWNAVAILDTNGALKFDSNPIMKMNNIDKIHKCY